MQLHTGAVQTLCTSLHYQLTQGETIFCRTWESNPWKYCTWSNTLPTELLCPFALIRTTVLQIIKLPKKNRPPINIITTKITTKHSQAKDRWVNPWATHSSYIQNSTKFSFLTFLWTVTFFPLTLKTGLGQPQGQWLWTGKEAIIRKVRRRSISKTVF